MNVKELYSILNEKIPQELSCPWDNDGLMCCPDGSREVRRVLVALDVTADVAEKAATEGYDLIVSHHPFIFKGLKSVTDDNFLGNKAISLISKGISVASFHTRLDAVEGGVNDTLASLLELKNVLPFGEEGIGRIGELEGNITLGELAKKVRKALGAPFVLCADGKKIPKRVAVLGGEGGDDIEAAREAGADTYISGRLGYHSMTDAPDFGMNLIEAGHYYTEAPVCAVLARLIREADEKIEVDIYGSNRILAI